MTRALRTAATLAVVAILATACSGLEFVQDRRLSFTTPATDKLTKLPVTLSWTMKDPSPGEEFAVFVDKSPLRIGKSLSSLLPAHTAATPEFLANINVYVTHSTSVVIDQIPDISSDRGNRQRHTAIVVLLNAQGKRTSESAWSRDFDLRKAGS